MRTLRIALTLSTALLFVPAQAVADAPDGPYSIAFDDLTHSIFASDINNATVDETFDRMCEFIPGEGLVCASGHTTGIQKADARGKLSGHVAFGFLFEFPDFSLSMDLSGPLTGKISGRGGANKQTAKVKLVGTLTIPGLPSGPAKGTMKFKQKTLPNGIFTHTLSIKICAKGLGCLKFPFDEPAIDRVDPDDGPWDLALDLNTDERGIVRGTASVNLTDDTFYRYQVNGKYSAKKDKSKLTLRASNGESRGSSVKIRNLATSAGAIDSAQVSYKIMGHKGKALVD